MPTPPDKATDKLEPILASASLEAIEHLRTGLLNAELAQRIEKNSQDRSETPFFIYRSLVKTSAISSACALEAYINEWFTAFEDPSENSPSRKTLITQLWSMGIPRTARYSILDKYQIALALMDSKKFNEGMKTFQNAKKLIKLRNTLVHYEPTFEPHTDQPDATNYKPNNLTKDLKGLFEYNTICEPNAPVWPHKILGSGCAKWCALAALNFMEEFHIKDTMEMSFPINRSEILESIENLSNIDWGYIFRKS